MNPPSRRERLEDLYRDFAQPLKTYAFHLVQNEHVAEDLVQEAFLKAWDAKGYDRVGNPEAWLRRVTHNAAVDYLRSSSSHLREFTGRELASADADTSLTENGHLPAYLQEALRELPTHYESVIRRHYLEEKQYKEIAEEQGISTANAKVRAHRARNKLRLSLLAYARDSSHEPV